MRRPSAEYATLLAEYLFARREASWGLPRARLWGTEVNEPEDAGELPAEVVPPQHFHIVDAEDHEWLRAGNRHDRDDRHLAREAGEMGLVEADAIEVVGAVRTDRPPHRVRAKQGHNELGAPETVLDLAHEVRARADLPLVAPDLVTENGEALIEVVGQLLGIAATVAEEEPRSGTGRCGRRRIGGRCRSPHVLAVAA
jgi:hypothetical protein